MQTPILAPETGSPPPPRGRRPGAHICYRQPWLEILLIDDNDPVRAVLQENLALAGHTVIEARNGQEGLNLFRQAGADLVITDLVMPGTEGMEVLLKLRAAQPPVKVIVMSGGGLGSGAQYLDMARLLGAAKVLLKPFLAAALIAAVDAVRSDEA